MRPLAIYLPQYHAVKENDKWWGKGFTEWVTVKRAHKYRNDQNQPKEPLNNDYYSLDDPNGEVLNRHAELAKKYGIYGFCFYHYWFKNNKIMLYKPMEILREHPEIDINYCICWANEPWRRTWYAGNSDILIDQEYGDENDWAIHYKYLSRFFADSRYIKVDNMPLVVIYRTAAISCLDLMIKKWNELAIRDGFNGIYLISERTSFDVDNRCECFSAYCDFEPAYSLKYRFSAFENLNRFVKRSFARFSNTVFKTKKIENVINMKSFAKKMGSDYRYNGLKVFPGVCASWDNTPRKGVKGLFIKKSTPSLFESAVKRITNNRGDDFLFINAWNEWSEGAYLEPDKVNKYAFLEALSKAIKND